MNTFSKCVTGLLIFIAGLILSAGGGDQLSLFYRDGIVGIEWLPMWVNWLRVFIGIPMVVVGAYFASINYWRLLIDKEEPKHYRAA